MQSEMKVSLDNVYSNMGNFDVLALVTPGWKKILDLGCGAGDNAKALLELGNTVDGITLSEEEADIVKKFLRNVFVYNLENGLPEAVTEKYDVVVLSHVLEHICYPGKLLQDIKKIVHAESRIIIALPNIMNYKSRIQLLLGNFDYKDAGVWDYTHFRWYTVKSAKQLMKDNGYEIVYADVAGELPFGRISKRILSSKVEKFLFRMLKSVSKGLFGSQLLMVVKLP